MVRSLFTLRAAYEIALPDDMQDERLPIHDSGPVERLRVPSITLLFDVESPVSGPRS